MLNNFFSGTIYSHKQNTNTQTSIPIRNNEQTNDLFGIESTDTSILENMIDYHNIRSKQDNIIEEYTTNGISKTFTYNNNDGGEAKTYINGELNTITIFDNEQQTKSKTLYHNGKIQNVIEYNEDKSKTIYKYDNAGVNKTKKLNIDENGFITDAWKYNFATLEWETDKVETVDIDTSKKLLNTKLSNNTFMIKNSTDNTHELSSTNNDTIKVKLTDNEYQKLNKSGLLQQAQFKPNEIQSILKLNEEDFNVAMNFIKNRPGIEYKYVERYLNS